MRRRAVSSWLALAAAVPLLALPMPCCTVAWLVPGIFAGCCGAPAGAGEAQTETDVPACPNCALAENGADTPPRPPATPRTPADCCCYDVPQHSGLLTQGHGGFSFEAPSFTFWAPPVALGPCDATTREAALARHAHPPLRVLLCTWLI